MNIRILLTVFVSLMYLSSIAQGDIITAKAFMDMTKADKSLVIIDASKSDTYKTSHVKNAVSIPHTTLYKSGDIDGLIKSPADLAKLFGSKGVSDKSTIVIYDGGSQKYSSRVYWILKYLGAPNVKLLHKDMNSWKKVRVPLTKMVPTVKSTTFTPNVNNAIYTDMAYVKAHAKDASVKLIDARTAAEFNGTSEKPVSPGHIPGAININYTDVLTSTEAYRSKADLEALAGKYGLSADTEIIVYCKTSVRGAVLYVAFVDILGYKNVKVYDGALAEWETKNEVVK